MKTYVSLFKGHRDHAPEATFAHFYPIDGDYDEPFKIVARQSIDGIDAWHFHQDRFKNKHPNTSVPKLKNYLNYTFKRLLDLEKSSPGQYFLPSKDGEWISFNTGLNNIHGSDLLAIFQRYKSRAGAPTRPDWVFKGCYAPNDRAYRDRFGLRVPELAYYSTDSRDFVFNIKYQLERDVFDHLFERAKERAGLPNANDEVVRNYLRGALELLVPKIKRNYKVAIPVWYVEEKRMQLLLPFISASNSSDVSCFLVDRDDNMQSYRLKTIFDLDQAYFSARLITRPDKEWLDP
jgi:hypothetical protein